MPRREDRIDWLSDFIQSDISKLGECEFFLISEMKCQLIVHHPYRNLLELQTRLNLTPDEVSLSWSIINDHYLTDVPFLFPPHIVALTAIFLCLVLKPTHVGSQTAATATTALSSMMQNVDVLNAEAITPTSTALAKVQYLVKWLAEGKIDIKAMIDCTQEILSLYEVWEQYNEKVCKEQIFRFVMSRGLDK